MLNTTPLSIDWVCTIFRHTHSKKVINRYWQNPICFWVQFIYLYYYYNQCVYLLKHSGGRVSTIQKKNTGKTCTAHAFWVWRHASVISWFIPNQHTKNRIRKSLTLSSTTGVVPHQRIKHISDYFNHRRPKLISIDTISAACRRYYNTLFT